MGNLTGSLFDNSGGSLVVTDLAVDGTTVVVDETNDRVGIGAKDAAYCRRCCNAQRAGFSRFGHGSLWADVGKDGHAK